MTVLLAHLSLQALSTSFLGWVRLASFGQSGLISEPHINFRNGRNGLNDHKGSKNINYTIVKPRVICYPQIVQ